MRTTVGMLRRIIREEAQAHLNENSDWPELHKIFQREADELDKKAKEVYKAISGELNPKQKSELKIHLVGPDPYISFGSFVRTLEEKVGELTPAELWDLESGEMLAVINNFNNWCRSNMPDSQELADLAESFENLMRKIEDSVPEERKVRSNSREKESWRSAYEPLSDKNERLRFKRGEGYVDPPGTRRRIR